MNSPTRPNANAVKFIYQNKVGVTQRWKFSMYCTERLLFWAALNGVAIDSRSISAAVATKRYIYGYKSDSYDSLRLAVGELSDGMQEIKESDPFGKNGLVFTVANLIYDITRNIARGNSSLSGDSIERCVLLMGEEKRQYIDKMRSLEREFEKVGEYGVSP